MTSLTQRLTGRRSGKGGFPNFSKNLSIFKPRLSNRLLQDHFTRLMMASESCSTSSSSFGDDFVPIFFLRKVMESLRRSYDKKRSTIRWMKQTQLQLKLSPVKTKAIQTWNFVSLLLQWEHILVSVRRVLHKGSIEGRTASVFWIMSSAWRKFTQRRTTARRSTTVAVDLPLFARIFLQLLVLDGVERLFGHDQAPSKCLPQQQVIMSGNLLFFATCASLPRRWIVHSPLFVFFLQIFAVSGSD